MGSFFYSPSEAFENTGEGPFDRLGPLFSLQRFAVPAVNGTFGTIGGEMPNGFLPTANTTRDSLIGALGTLAGTAIRSLLQGTTPGGVIPCGPNDTRLECQFTAPGTVTSLPAAVVGTASCGPTGRGTCTALVTTKSGKQVHRKGTLLALPNGQVICCPKKRRMSPCNPHAARRAVRRLSMVHSFMRSIEKSMNKACAPSTRRRSRRTQSSGCGSCGKIRCTCK